MSAEIKTSSLPAKSPPNGAGNATAIPPTPRRRGRGTRAQAPQESAEEANGSSGGSGEDQKTASGAQDGSTSPKKPRKARKPKAPSTTPEAADFALYGRLCWECRRDGVEPEERVAEMRRLVAAYDLVHGA